MQHKGVDPFMILLNPYYGSICIHKPKELPYKKEQVYLQEAVDHLHRLHPR